MREQIATTLGDAARAAREHLGLTQAEVAGLMELSPVVYNRLERGRMLPSVPTLVLLCETLRVSPAELLGFPRRAPPRKAVASEEDPPSLSQLLTLARKLDDTGRQALITVAKALLR
ncbi:MAG: helix-turn-helix domain-containing protein [Hyalangium sp.]|uniref:helix-turn-helix domain-containing protein n=1 Tax=Hyalangium sp. TaxID=2028555 RepID=UPI00389A84E4